MWTPHDLDPRQFEYFVFTTRAVYKALNLIEVSSENGERVLESRQFCCGEGMKENGRFRITFQEKHSIFSWQYEVESKEVITGIKVVFPLIPDGVVVFPEMRGKKALAEGETWGPLRINFLQAFLVEYPDGSALFFDFFEIPPREKPLTVQKLNGKLKLSIIFHELAYYRDSHFKSPVCRLQRVTGWQEAADKLCASLEKSLKLVPFKQRTDVPLWAKEISLVVNLDGLGYFGEQNHNFDQAAQRLNELSKLFPPQKTLICMAGFMGRFDFSSASFTPAPELGGQQGFSKFMRTAHKLGFHIMILGNLFGIGAELMQEHADLLEESPIILPNKETYGWRIDWKKDEIGELVIKHVSPDNARWRKVLIDGIGSLVEKYSIDGYFLDQSFCYPNDINHDHYRGLCALIEELRERCPELLIAGEGLANYLIPLTPFATAHPPVLQTDVYHPILDYVFNRYTRRFMHLIIYSPDNKWGAFPFGVCVEPVSMQNNKSVPEEGIRDHKYDARCFERGVMPTLMLSNWTVDLKCSAAEELIQFARRY